MVAVVAVVPVVDLGEGLTGWMSWMAFRSPMVEGCTKGCEPWQPGLKLRLPLGDIDVDRLLGILHTGDC